MASQHSSRDPSPLSPVTSFSFRVDEAMQSPQASPIHQSIPSDNYPLARSKRSSLYASQATSEYTPTATPSGPRQSTLTPESAERPRTMSPAAGASGLRNPFGYQTQTYTLGQQPIKSAQEVGKRRGHRYKHSSVSHQIFQEPVQRAPLRLPASLPIPTTKEGWKSMSREQTLRLAWCFCHLFVAGYVQWNAQGSLAVTALSHLVFYDAIGAFLCAGVEVLGNFEVWKRSTIRQPFGLERTEVLVGFAMSILLLFMGFDLLSHNASHLLSSLAPSSPTPTHTSSHVHPPTERASATTLDFICLLTIATTLISAFSLSNHARLARAMRLRVTSLHTLGIPTVLSNPSHLFTLSCAAILLLLPALPTRSYATVDALVSSSTACVMCVLGGKLVHALGAMLLMSVGDASGVGEVVAAIERERGVKGVQEARFWQVHYGLCVAGVKVKVERGVWEEELRERIGRVVTGRLGGRMGGGGGDGKVADGEDDGEGAGKGGGMGWDISLQFIVEGEGE